MASKKKNVFVRHKLAAVAAGTILLVAGSIGVAKRSAAPGEIVTAVIDGDSFKIANDQTIRLASLDAPDVHYCFGKEGAEALSKKFSVKKLS